MSLNTFDQCARELEERAEARYTSQLIKFEIAEALMKKTNKAVMDIAQSSILDYLAQCDYCGAEHDERKMFNVDGDIICPECKAKIDQEEEDRDNPPICAYCNGSGEGMYDGTRCWHCKGEGVER